jgi:sensor histidine kinase regulating citrate/malate metabolism
VWYNIGSAALLPEVFLKAVAVARNLGADLDDIYTVNMDMIRHYRPTQNVIGRPVRGGNGLELIGHHEIMLPILRQAIVEKMNR